MFSTFEKTRERLRPLLIVVLSAAAFLDIINLSGVIISLPSIGKDLGLQSNELSWIITAYALTFGGFLLLVGRLGDLYGHRWVVLFGLGWFALWSFVSGAAPNKVAIIISRALQGIGAASTVPGSFAIISATWSEGSQRDRALGILSSAGGLGGVVGGLLAGGLSEPGSLGWRWVFYISALVAFILFLLGIVVLPPTSQRKEKAVIDYLGALAITTGILLLVYVFSEGNNVGWGSPQIIVIAVVGVLAILAFVYVEAKVVSDPLMPLSIWGIPNFAAIFIVILCQQSAFNGFLFFISLYYQEFRLSDPLQTSVYLLPAGLGGVLFAILWGVLMKRLGGVLVIKFGMLVEFAALLILAQIDINTKYWSLIFPSLILLMLGLTATFVSSAILLTSLASENQQGLFGALFSVAQQVGSALGIAILIAISSAVSSSSGSPIKGLGAGLYGCAALAGLGFFIALLAIWKPRMTVKEVVMEEGKEGEAVVV